MRRTHRTAGSTLRGDRSVHLLSAGAAPLPMLDVSGLWHQIPPLYRLAGIAVLAAALAGLAYGGVMRAMYGRRRPWLSLWTRLRLRMHPGPGFAGKWTLWRQYGKPAARKIARRRPSVTWKTLCFGPWQHYATFLGDAQGWVHRWRCYSSYELLRLNFAGPQIGKSLAAAGEIIDAPGPVLATTIRGDLIRNTAGLRQAVGKLWTWNPEQVGEWGSNMRWNPVPGCEDMVVAVRRAGYMVEAIDNGGLSDAAFWTDQSALVLSGLLHAAALIKGDMRDVQRWLVERSEEPLDILSRARKVDGNVAESAIVELGHYLTMPIRTQGSVATTINNCLRFMNHPGIVSMLIPRTSPVDWEEQFDFEEFLNSRDTVYMISGGETNSPSASLFAAFLGELVHHARYMGDRQPGINRIDPPLHLTGDELANVAPVPVCQWASWLAGSGIHASLWFQSWAQIVQRWGEDAAKSLWQSCRTKVFYGGSSEKALLESVSELCGKVRVRDHDDVQHDQGRKHRKPKTEEIDVLPAAQVRMLPPARAVIIHDRAKATIVTVEDVRKRADYRAWRRSGAAINLPAPQIQTPAEPNTHYRTPHALPRHDHRPAAAPDELAARRTRRPVEAPPLPRPLGPQPAPWPGTPIQSSPEDPAGQEEHARHDEAQPGDTTPIPVAPRPGPEASWITPPDATGSGDQ